MPEDLVATLGQASLEPRRYRPLFEQGQKVRIVAGGFATLEAVFEMAEGEQRATVLLDLLGRRSRIKVEVGNLLPAD